MTDERLASALGFRVTKLYNETRANQTATQRPDDHRDVVVLERGEEMRERPNRLISASQNRLLGTMVYIIVLILLSASIFGLEVYRIREVSDLTNRMESINNNLELLRNQLAISMSPSVSERELMDLIKSKSEIKMGHDEKTQVEYHHIP